MRDQELMDIKKRLDDLESKSRDRDFVPKSIKQRFLEAFIIYRGLAADRPTDGNESERWFYFAYDTNTLYAWNGTAYVSEVLT